MTYTVLDLFSGAGGAAMGYHQAGFKVIGIDINPMPRFPFEFHQADAIAYLDAMITYGFQGIDAIHASPPCQQWSSMMKTNITVTRTHPDFITPTRERLKKIGLPYVIENVPRAPLIDPVILCGSQFGLTVHWPGKYEFALRRHRKFEASFTIPDAGKHDHSLPTMCVVTHSSPGVWWHKKHGSSSGYLPVARKLMEIDWMNSDELAESIPPAYTRYTGKYLMEELRKINDIR